MFSIDIDLNKHIISPLITPVRIDSQPSWNGAGITVCRISVDKVRPLLESLNQWDVSFVRSHSFVLETLKSLILILQD